MSEVAVLDFDPGCGIPTNQNVGVEFLNPLGNHVVLLAHGLHRRSDLLRLNERLVEYLEVAWPVIVAEIVLQKLRRELRNGLIRPGAPCQLGVVTHRVHDVRMRTEHCFTDLVPLRANPLSSIPAVLSRKLFYVLDVRHISIRRICPGALCMMRQESSVPAISGLQSILDVLEVRHVHVTGAEGLVDRDELVAVKTRDAPNVTHAVRINRYNNVPGYRRAEHGGQQQSRKNDVPTGPRHAEHRGQKQPSKCDAPTGLAPVERMIAGCPTHRDKRS